MSSKTEQTPIEIKSKKAKLRESARKILANLKKQGNIDARIQSAVKKIKSSKEYKKAKTVLLYHALPDEVDLSLLMDDASKRWVLPRAIGGGKMLLYEVNSFEGLIQGRYEVMVPPATNPLIKKEQIDLVIAPGLMFDKKGYRLGRGAGYYDVLLSETESDTIAVCFEELYSEALPHEEHDETVGSVIVI